MFQKIVLAIFICLPLLACSPHQLQEDYAPKVSIEEQFSQQNAINQKDPHHRENWLHSFNQQDLNSLYQQAKQNNLTLQQAWKRLNQAALTARIAGAALFPELGINASASGQDIDISSRNGTVVFGNGWSDEASVTGVLSWQIDLWGRIRAGNRQARALANASAADLRNTDLTLSAGVTRAYFDLQEQIALKNLLNEQIRTSKQFLELTNLRKSTGRGSILDIKQQEQQLLALQSNLPTLNLTIEQTQHSLAILLGQSAISYTYEPVTGLPDLPPLQTLGTPQNLLQQNPQLQAAYNRLKAADHNIAVELADRLPSLSFSASYDISSSNLGSPLENTIFSLSGAIAQSIFDAGRRKNETKRAREAFEEEWLAFSQVYLTVIGDVENALAAEKRLLETLQNTQQQIIAAEITLREAQAQYISGLSDYLNVLNALGTLQNLQREHVQQQRNLLDARINLHLALGGPLPWSEKGTEAQTNMTRNDTTY